MHTNIFTEFGLEKQKLDLDKQRNKTSAIKSLNIGENSDGGKYKKNA